MLHATLKPGVHFNFEECYCAGASPAGKQAWFDCCAEDDSTPADLASAAVNERVQNGISEVRPHSYACCSRTSVLRRAYTLFWPAPSDCNCLKVLRFTPGSSLDAAGGIYWRVFSSF